MRLQPQYRESAVAALPIDHGGIPSAEPATTKTPDGWTLTIFSKDETVLPVQPLTTALSSRDYMVGGTFAATLVGPGGAARGVLEVGYQIGCGIDMSTSNGVTLAGTGGQTLSVGTTGPFLGPPTVLPIVTDAGDRCGDRRRSSPASSTSFRWTRRSSKAPSRG